MLASDLVALFKYALREKWGYIWGTAGVTWTREKQDAATRTMTVRYGERWIGKTVADCSGLFVWAFKQCGANIYHGSNTIWDKYCSKRGVISPGIDLRPGTAVFLTDASVSRHHIGLYVGDGKCIEAKGTLYGVVESPITRWDEWGELKGVDYDMGADVLETIHYTVKRGNSGALVQELQELLISRGYSCGEKGADGIFGTETEKAVKQYQADNYLTVDGVCGDLTWSVLLEEALEEPDEKQEESESEEPTLEDKVNVLWTWYREMEAESDGD